MRGPFLIHEKSQLSNVGKNIKSWMVGFSCAHPVYHLRPFREFFRWCRQTSERILREMMNMDPSMVWRAQRICKDTLRVEGDKNPIDNHLGWC